jgi:hypothetical protein
MLHGWRFLYLCCKEGLHVVMQFENQLTRVTMVVMMMMMIIIIIQNVLVHICKQVFLMTFVTL